MKPVRHFAAALAVAACGTWLGGLVDAAPASAIVRLATATNLRDVFAAAQGGDTIRVTGSIGTMTLYDRAFSKQVVLDAQGATFTDSLSIANVSNLTILGGTFGSFTMPMRTSSAMSIYNSSNIILTKTSFIGNGTGVGLRLTDVSKSTVSAGMFNGFKAGMTVVGSSDVRLSSNRFANMTSDGIDIADSHRVTATTNWCYAVKPSDGAHPDCIQMWSIAGNPIMSDILVTKTNVKGDTQGITLFDNGGLRISITDNIVNTSYPQGIACYDCVDSLISGNTLTTIPGSRWRTSINVVGGSNNIVANNSVGALPPQPLARLAALSLITTNGAIDPVPDFILEDLARIRQDMANGLLDPAPSASSVAAIPEPALWAELILGFGIIGATRRRQGLRLAFVSTGVRQQRL